MVYPSIESFREAALACGAGYYADGSLEPGKLNAAYLVYQNALGKTKLLNFDGQAEDFGVTVVGRLALKSDGRWVPSNEDFPSIDEIMRENLGVMADASGATGAVLDAKNWSLLANDAWLLGGIHARTEFHFASPLSWENFWDGQRERMTVTAREAIGIISFGYEIARPTKLEAVAVCRGPELASGAGLQAYSSRVQACITGPALRSIWEKVPEAARSY